VTPDQIIANLLKVEGGYVDNPADPGGATNFGVTEAVARANGFTGPMQSMTAADATGIYRNEYWHKPGYDSVFGLFPELAAELFDCGVNMGTVLATSFLQRCLNVFNREQHDYRDIPVDGQLGGATLEALHDFLTRRGDEGEHTLLKAYLCLRGARYIELAEHRAADEEFVFGWISDRVSMSV
jgi:lysozyme family protein